MNQTELTSFSQAEHLVGLIRQAQDWEEVEAAIASFPRHKAAAWQLLYAEKSRIRELKRWSEVLPGSLMGRRVVVAGYSVALERKVYLSPCLMPQTLMISLL